MITDKDIQKLAKVLSTKEDLNELAADVVRIEERIDGIDNHLKNMPTRDELTSLFEKTFNFLSLKTEHERMKKIIHEKLGVEV
ncbi:hypothetical protein A2924_00460 [Candidatus Giovannonibacteria bacterium RIFCSPLOWO2_01_FULL_44_16]|uniref:Uncharacterized protein n=1 Tax=Candidatus Giovannonibacteria bacterium RIFCSPLOWO2_01_FULL_44_16 TaxID=1798348 RepID=A0A1F5X2K3_9BACT|nr:MAG: hypothetical protein A2924_00460 [Candidatus Giovannonibacteria bacterium RIFCSPLOWO2_01_FULL_44_16]